jgi:hypothetical protein
MKLINLAMLMVFANGCHAPAHRAPKAPVDQSVNTAAKKGSCAMQGAFVTALQTKHSDMTNLRLGQMRPVMISGSPVNHFVAVFTTVAAMPAASRSPGPTLASQGTLASAFIDPGTCAFDGYEETAEVGSLNQRVPSCADPQRAMGSDGAAPNFAFLNYGDTFKSPYETLMGASLFEVYSVVDNGDGTTNLTQYFFDQSPCHVSFPEKTVLTDPAATAKVKKGSGS